MGKPNFFSKEWFHDCDWSGWEEEWQDQSESWFLKELIDLLERYRTDNPNERMKIWDRTKALNACMEYEYLTASPQQFGQEMEAIHRTYGHLNWVKLFLRAAYRYKTGVFSFNKESGVR